MKRTILAVFMGVILLAFGLLNVEAQSVNLPRIIRVEGGLVSVNLLGEGWVPAQKGMDLEPESVIKTGGGAYCDITLDKDLTNIISIGPNSEVTISEYFEKIEIAQGRVFAQLKGLKPGSTFEVVTPTAIAGVRGTSFESIADLISSKFQVPEGTVSVKGVDKDGKVTDENDVKEGKAISVDENGFLGALQDITEKDKIRLQNWSTKLAKLRAQFADRDQVSCGDMIESFKGASGRIFEQVLECETGETETFAAGPDNSDLFRGDGDDQGIGDDITNKTLEDETPIVEDEIPEPEEPEECPYPCEPGSAGCPC